MNKDYQNYRKGSWEITEGDDHFEAVKLNQSGKVINYVYDPEYGKRIEILIGGSGEQREVLENYTESDFNSVDEFLEIVKKHYSENFENGSD